MSSDVIRRGLTLLRAPGAELGFAVRRALRFSRGTPPALASSSEQHAVSDGRHPLAAAGDFGEWAWLAGSERRRLQPRLQRLATRYDLSALLRADVPVETARNCARLEQLERLAGNFALPATDGAVRAADFGSGDFHYAIALQQWLANGGGCDGSARTPRQVVLRGFELDGYGVYRDGFARVDHARARAAAASMDGSEVRYEVADAAFVRLPPQDVVTLFFPFLSAYASLSWGMPLSRLRPRRLLGRAVDSIRPGGWLVVANQTAAEYRRMHRLLAGMPVTRIRRCRFATDLVPEAARTCGQIGSLWLRQ
ncbi:MAG: hypothetical protein AB8H80_23610 [Planctomycetota bacterium]